MGKDCLYQRQTEVTGTVPCQAGNAEHSIATNIQSNYAVTVCHFT